MLSFKKMQSWCTFSDIVLLLSLVLVGGFNEYLSCVIAVALLICLLLKIHRSGCFKVTVNWLSVAVAVMVVFYGLTIFWAIDSGMAFVGFLKFLPLLLYLSLLQQADESSRVCHLLPYVVALMTAVSSVGSVIPFTKDLFLVSGRLAGFFQYPNTFALLILVAELLLFKKERWGVADYGTAVVLVGGLLYTGSRTVFVLFLLSNFVMIVTKLSGKRRLAVFGIAAVAVLTVAGVAFFGPEGNLFSRYIKLGLTQSTFVGRLLYMQDALPLLLKYPFGMGYFGYHYVQGSIQTGLYNVSFVHNDILQIGLDVGILPMLLFAAAIGRYLCKKSISLTDKIIVAVFTLHTMFDFNLQFVGMFLLYLTLLKDEEGRVFTIHHTAALKTGISVMAAVSLYMCIPLALCRFAAYQASYTLYPYNTRNTLLLLEQQKDVNKADEIAQKILTYNTQYYAPYSIRAKQAYSQGDFVSVMENKREVFSRNRFRYGEYREYGVMLANGIVAYEKMGDHSSAAILRKELQSLKEQVESLDKRVSKLGSMIDEQPVLGLPDNVLQYLEQSDGEEGGSY